MLSPPCGRRAVLRGERRGREGSKLGVVGNYLLRKDFVLLCCFTGSSAVTPVFVQKGKDLLLEVMEPDVPENFSLLSWRFNGKDVLVRFLPSKEPIVSNVVYTGRVEASVKNFSVKLKNLQEADSGVYTARVIGTEEEQKLAGYNVTVQVSPVAMTVDSVSSSSDSCSLTVTCSTQDSQHINSTFTCDTNTCSQEGGERSKVTSSGASLNVYLLNDLIICNHSNHVSWTNDIIVNTLQANISKYSTVSASKKTRRWRELLWPAMNVITTCGLFFLAAIFL
uniref:Immunoglobulin V-set domain-containing protein n=1 Tax=Seriola lalandi dorsalis TaxID=1841481 RepID=A0A3B4WXT8_SERLL